MLTERARSELDRQALGWLTTVTPDGRPQASAVWFVTDGDDIIVYSRPDATRMENLGTNPHVAFNLQGDRFGMHIVTLEGRAAVDPDLPPAGDPGGRYLDKYGAEMERLGWDPGWYESRFSVGLRIEVTRERSW